MTGGGRLARLSAGTDAIAVCKTALALPLHESLRPQPLPGSPM